MCLFLYLILVITESLSMMEVGMWGKHVHYSLISLVKTVITTIY